MFNEGQCTNDLQNVSDNTTEMPTLHCTYSSHVQPLNLTAHLVRRKFFIGCYAKIQPANGSFLRFSQVEHCLFR